MNFALSFAGNDFKFHFYGVIVSKLEIPQLNIFGKLLADLLIISINVKVFT